MLFEKAVAMEHVAEGEGQAVEGGGSGEERDEGAVEEGKAVDMRVGGGGDSSNYFLQFLH